MRNPNKLEKVNVPELFYGRFLANVPAGESIVVDKLKKIKPIPRGRGYTRVVENITEAEWEDLYARAVAARSRIRGAERYHELRPTICAKMMTFRMEALGVANIVRYETYKFVNGIEKPKSTLNLPKVVDKKVDDVVAAIQVTQASVVPEEPITLDTADDVDEALEADVARFKKDLELSNAKG